MSLHQRSAPRRLMGVSAVAACIALVAVGCSNTSSTSNPTGAAGSGTPTSAAPPTTGPTGSAGSSTGSQYGFPTVAQDPTAKITVWVDADRSAIAKAFQTDHPECPLAFETYDASAGGSDTFHQKVSLADQAGSGWPDVAWSGQVNDASWAAHPQNGVQAFAAALDQGVVPQKWLDGYTPGALDPVTVDGHVYGALVERRGKGLNAVLRMGGPAGVVHLSRPRNVGPARAGPAGRPARPFCGTCRYPRRWRRRSRRRAGTRGGPSRRPWRWPSGRRRPRR